jgi:hypothetical protein
MDIQGYLGMSGMGCPPGAAGWEQELSGSTTALAAWW